MLHMLPRMIDADFRYHTDRYSRQASPQSKHNCCIGREQLQLETSKVRDHLLEDEGILINSLVNAKRKLFVADDKAVDLDEACDDLIIGHRAA